MRAGSFCWTTFAGIFGAARRAFTGIARVQGEGPGWTRAADGEPATGIAPVSRSYQDRVLLLDDTGGWARLESNQRLDRVRIVVCR